MKLIPVNGKILAKKVENKKEGASPLLILPDLQNDIYEVVDYENAYYMPGDRIIVDRYDALEKIIDEQKYYFIPADRVLAKVE